MTAKVTPFQPTKSSDARVPVNMVCLTTEFTEASLAFTMTDKLDQYTIPDAYLPVDITQIDYKDMNLDISGFKGALAGFCADTKAYNTLVAFAEAIDNTSGDIGVDADATLKLSKGIAWKRGFKTTAVGELVGTGQKYPLFNELYGTVDKLAKRSTLYAPYSSELSLHSMYEQKTWITAPMPPSRLLGAFFKHLLVSSTTKSAMSFFTSLRMAVLNSIITDVQITENSLQISWTPQMVSWYQAQAQGEKKDVLDATILPDLILGWAKHVARDGKRRDLGNLEVQFIDPHSAWYKIAHPSSDTPKAYNIPTGGTVAVDFVAVVADQDVSLTDDADVIEDGRMAFIEGSEQLKVEISIPTYEADFTDENCPRSEEDTQCLTNAGQLGLISQFNANDPAADKYYQASDLKQRKKLYDMKHIDTGSSSDLESENAGADIPSFKTGDKAFKAAADASTSSYVDALSEEFRTIYEQDIWYAVDGVDYAVVTSIAIDVAPSEHDPVHFLSSENFLNSTNAPDMFPAAVCQHQLPLIIPKAAFDVSTDKKTQAVTVSIRSDENPKSFCTFAAYQLGSVWYNRKIYKKLLKCEYDHNVQAYINRAKTDGNPDDPEPPKKFPWWILIVIAIPLLAACIVAASSKKDGDRKENQN